MKFKKLGLHNRSTVRQVLVRPVAMCRCHSGARQRLRADAVRNLLGSDFKVGGVSC